MAPFNASSKIIQKIRALHQVEVEEVREAFYNHFGKMMRETREEHQRELEKLWFISETDAQRLLKVVVAENGDTLELITAYDPDEEDINYYEKLQKENE